jgi:hypothetical protein
MNGAQRQAAYLKRRKERLAHDAIEGNRYVRALETKLR